MYGSLDTHEDVYCSTSYRVVSTDDLLTWTAHPTSFSTEAVPWAGSPSRGRSMLDGARSYDDLPAWYLRQKAPAGVPDVPFEEFAAAVRAATAQQQPAATLLYAPDAIEHQGRYLLYFCASDDSEGVAISDSPTGPFAHAERLPISGIDPSVLVDDDGRAYLYWGQFSANVARLGPDMVSIVSSSVVEGIVSEATHHFHEGSSVRKRNGIYYLVFADTSRGRPTSLGYATSVSPTGPFAYRGVIIDNAAADPEAWNNHGCIAEYRGEWFVFYHRPSRRSPRWRRLCAERISFAADGSIPEVRMSSHGLGAPFAPGETIPAASACELDGSAFIGPDHEDEALFVEQDGDRAVYRLIRAQRPLREIRVDRRGSSTVEVHLGGSHLATLGPDEATAPIDAPAGDHDLTLVFRQPLDTIVSAVRVN